MPSYLSQLAIAGTLVAGMLSSTSAAPSAKRVASADPLSRRLTDSFYYVQFQTDKFLTMTGNLVVPARIPAGGTPYVWPGLEPADQGVLQPVLDGRSQRWYFGNTWYGSPSEPYGGGIDVGVNDVTSFYMRNYDGNGNWQIGVSDGSKKADYTFDLGHQMVYGLFCAEIYSDATWDFGDVTFTDVVMTAAGTDASWCTSNPTKENVRADVVDVSSSVSNGVVTCKVGRITLYQP